jgi:hypothetical protein
MKREEIKGKKSKRKDYGKTKEIGELLSPGQYETGTGRM